MAVQVRQDSASWSLRLRQDRSSFSFRRRPARTTRDCPPRCCPAGTSRLPSCGRDPFADEGVARNLRGTHRGALLNLDKGADPRLVADPAAVAVDELENLDVAAQA